MDYCSSENYFQCAKCISKEEFENVRKSGSGTNVWIAGNNVKLRNDWEVIKIRAMYNGNRAKFEQDKNLKELLLSTKGSIVFDGSTNFWNMWNSRILELIREELRSIKERDQSKIKAIWTQIDEHEGKIKKLLKL